MNGFRKLCIDHFYGEGMAFDLRSRRAAITAIDYSLLCFFALHSQHRDSTHLKQSSTPVKQMNLTLLRREINELKVQRKELRKLNAFYEAAEAKRETEHREAQSKMQQQLTEMVESLKGLEEKYEGE